MVSRYECETAREGIEDQVHALSRRAVSWRVMALLVTIGIAVAGACVVFSSSALGIAGEARAKAAAVEATQEAMEIHLSRIEYLIDRQGEKIDRLLEK